MNWQNFAQVGIQLKFALEYGCTGKSFLVLQK